MSCAGVNDDGGVLELIHYIDVNNQLENKIRTQYLLMRSKPNTHSGPAEEVGIKRNVPNHDAQQMQMIQSATVHAEYCNADYDSFFKTL